MDGYRWRNRPNSHACSLPRVIPVDERVTERSSVNFLLAPGASPQARAYIYTLPGVPRSMGGCTPALRTARLPRSTRHSPHTPRAATNTRPVPDTLGRPGCMSNTAGVAMRECKRPGMTSSLHSPRVCRLSRPGAVSARSVGAAAVSPGGDIIICPPPTRVLSSNSHGRPGSGREYQCYMRGE